MESIADKFGGSITSSQRLLAISLFIFHQNGTKSLLPYITYSLT
jgi:hypothetical protein